MTRQDLRNELIAFRFNAQQANSINSWLNLAYQQLWCMDAWPFRKVKPTAVSVSAASTGIMTMPSDFHRATGVYDVNGYPLRYLAPKAFSDVYVSNTQTGTPQDYTLYNNVVYIGPGPQQATTMSLAYLRRISRLVNGTTDTAGVMTDDADVPTFPSEYHYMLVFGAMSLGLRLENDPTYPSVDDSWQMSLQLMRSDLMPADQGENIQFGRLDWA